MVIEYRIKRFDLVKTYFHNLLHSKRTQLIIFGSDILITLYVLFIRYKLLGVLAFKDYLFALISGIAFLFLIPALMFLTAKIQMRTLTISPEGIETSIGSQYGRLTWKKIESITATDDRIFIIGKNANSFTIPASAFTTPDSRNHFIDLAKQYHEDR